MRLTEKQAQAILALAIQLAGEPSRVWLFGSRLDDETRGGDCDLMLELTEPSGKPCSTGRNILSQSKSFDAWPQSGRITLSTQSGAFAHP